jgi:hypothetical protein
VSHKQCKQSRFWNKSTGAGAFFLDLGFSVELFFGHGHIVEGKKFLLTMSTDKSAHSNRLELVGIGVFVFLSAMWARQHAAIVMKE